MITALQKESASWLNQLDAARGRTRYGSSSGTSHLTFERSYLARLNYVHENAVHHGIVARAENYRWCSAKWFLDRVSRAHYESVRRFGSERLNVPDEF
jgi:putative transposase